MYQDQRVIYNTIDFSPKVNDFRAGTQNFAYTAGSYLYVGSILPFNNLWFEMGTLNVNATTLTVKIWWGNAWHDAVDVIDETVGLTVNGRIVWNTDRLKGWDIEQTSEDISGGLSSFKIYNHFWVRLDWSADFSGGSTLKYVGQKFATDAKLYSMYPDLNNTQLLTSFAASKTSWDEQHYMAAEQIVRDLKKADIIKSRSQILDYSLFQDAACHKVAEIAYVALGRPYFDQLQEARKQYKEAMNMKFFGVDLNQNGSLDQVERATSTGFMRR